MRVVPFFIVYFVNLCEMCIVGWGFIFIILLVIFSYGLVLKESECVLVVGEQIIYLKLYSCAHIVI